MGKNRKEKRGARSAAHTPAKWPVTLADMVEGFRFYLVAVDTAEFKRIGESVSFAGVVLRRRGQLKAKIVVDPEEPKDSLWVDEDAFPWLVRQALPR